MYGSKEAVHNQASLACRRPSCQTLGRREVCRMPDTDPYEDDGEGYGTSIYRGSDGITTTYGGWLTMLRIALLYGWVPEGGSYSSNRGARRRILSDADATNIHLALER